MQGAESQQIVCFETETQQCIKHANLLLLLQLLPRIFAQGSRAAAAGALIVLARKNLLFIHTHSEGRINGASELGKDVPICPEQERDLQLKERGGS